jgi:hypothetical protein
MSPLQHLIILLFPFLLRISFAQDSNSRTSEVNGFPDLYEASVEDLQIGLNAGQFTSVDLVKVRRTGRGSSLFSEKSKKNSQIKGI